MSLPTPGPDRAAVVTGASSGIGAEMARELHRRGHQVVLVARSADKLEALAAEFGERAYVLPADLSDRPTRADLLRRVEALGLTPDVLINNAGLSTLGPVAASDPDAEMNMVEVDVVAVADLCSRFLPGMVERGQGAVLNVAS
ncbi:MAG: SDR family NAD(P)-dependent oxidoreductase, partial [Jatrophihabitans sp.]|uniref:SDR family NAD(P)-dependent oxidoreductase n=1 Tax=Jatrophihabitans sp. TaxID=1932789 RepID=UPI00390D664E